MPVTGLVRPSSNNGKLARYVRALFGTVAIICGVLAIVPPQWPLSRMGGRKAQYVPFALFWSLTRLMGVKIQVTGAKTLARPTLFVSNHISWLDIFVLGALHGGPFVARGDMEGWPVFGWLSKLRRSVFVDRENRARARDQINVLIEKLKSDRSLILFAEGTSTDGLRVLDFKSSLFSVAEKWPGPEALTIQPISIAYTHLNGLPIARHYRPYIGWYGDMELAPHLWELLQLGRLTASVHYHAPITVDGSKSRKVLSQECRNIIAKRVEQLNNHLVIPGESD